MSDGCGVWNRIDYCTDDLRRSDGTSPRSLMVRGWRGMPIAALSLGATRNTHEEPRWVLAFLQSEG